jgi:uncharacterized protein YbjT (DUF2867 family)
MKALIIGATGATGKDLLSYLSSDADYEQVNIFVRQDFLKSHDKFNIQVINFDKCDEWKNLVNGDVLFSCLGTTLKIAGSKENMWKIDYDYQYQFAKSAKENGVKNYVLVSAGAASIHSPFFYNKMKGQLEEDIKKLGFEKTVILNPPLLERKDSNRIAEILGVKVIKFFNFFGLLKSQKPLPTNLLVKAMITSFKKLGKGEHNVSSKQIWEYLDN